MKGKIAKKVIMLIFICMLTMFDIFVVSKQIVQADGEEQIEQEKTEISIEQGIEKYFEVSENQILLQQRIDTLLNKDDKVRISEKLMVDVPEIGEKIPETVIVLLNGVKLPDNTYFYDVQNKILEISLNKENELFNDKQNIYKVIYTYSELSVEEKVNMVLNTDVTTNIENEGEITSTNEQKIETEVEGSNISLMGDITDEAYKGYLYQGTQSSTSYSEINRIEISSIYNLENITISNVAESFVEEEKIVDSRTNEETTIENEREVNQSIYYTSTKISKEDMLRILGDDGIITVYNQNDEILAEFNKDTKEDEDGNLVIQYKGEDVTSVKLVMTKPVQEGIIDIHHDKAIKANTGYVKQDIERFDYLRETIQANEEIAVMNMRLIEPETQFDVTLNKTEYSTMNTNKDVEISVTLKNNAYNMSLYENPEIEIVFPKEVKNLEIQEQVNILYDSELSIRDSYVEGNVVHILLNGVQTNYKEIGTQINLKINMTFDKKLTDRTSEIVTIIKNKSQVVENRKEVNLVSPREIITVNNIREFGIESYGGQKELIAGLEKNSNEKTIQVESEVINNTDNIRSLKILGELPTDSSSNNLGTTITTPVQVEGENAVVYYTTNENATEDLENSENGWVNDINAISNAKKYLIAVNEVNPDDSTKFTYSVSIPGDLEYNQKATEGYAVYYTDSESNIGNKAEATDVVLTTGDGPIVEAELVAKVNGEQINSGDTVKAGEKVSYEINLTNTGTEEATNVAIDLAMSQSDNAENDEIVNLNVESIEPNETKTVSYEKEIPTDLSNEITITANAKITYEEEQKNSNEIVLTVKPASIVGEVWWDTAEYRYDEDGNIIEEIQLTQGNIVRYAVQITNNTDEVQTGLILHWNFPTNSEMIMQEQVFEDTDKDSEELEVTNDLVLKDLQPRETINIIVSVYLGEFEEKTDVAYAVASIEQNGEVYRLGKTRERIVYNTLKFYDLKLSANDEDDYVQTGDEIVYTVTIKNNNLEEANVMIKDNIPYQLTITDIVTDKGEVENINNDITISDITLQPNETLTILIKTVVDYAENISEDDTITNQVILNTGSDIELESNIVKHIIDRQSNSPEDPDEPENPEDPDNPSQPSDTYRISGTVWIDSSSEGRRDDEELGIDGINVYLINAETNQTTEITAITNSEGFYTLANIPEGRYIVVFDYSSARYGITKYQVSGVEDNRNSKALAKQVNLFGTEKTYGVTDIITIDGGSIGNINMGLIELEEFDLRIDKYISRVIVKTQNSTNVYSYNDTSLARVDLDAKTINNSEVTVEYAIKITNVGQVEGYARRIIDYVPEGFTFDTSANKDWYGSGDEIYSVILANDKILPGESKTLTLTLTKKMSGEETGSYINRAGIDESYNELNVADTNSNNGVESSSAELLLSIRTGKAAVYTIFILLIIVIIGIGIYIIKVKVLDEKNEERR